MPTLVEVTAGQLRSAGLDAEAIKKEYGAFIKSRGDLFYDRNTKVIYISAKGGQNHENAIETSYKVS